MSEGADAIADLDCGQCLTFTCLMFMIKQLIVQTCRLAATRQVDGKACSDVAWRQVLTNSTRAWNEEQ